MVIARAVIVGLAVSAAGGVPWVLLSGWNLRMFVSVPWATLLTAAYLWLFWRYLGGAGWPRSTAEWRRTNLRANRLSGEIWGTALFAGILGLAAQLPLVGIMARLV